MSTHSLLRGTPAGSHSPARTSAVPIAVLAVLIFAFLVTGCSQVTDSGSEADTASGRPNIVLIMADDVGYEAFGAYGSEQYETPRIDELAEKGMRFTYAFSQPLCTPTRVEIMTGRSNIRNYTAFGVLDPGETTFADVLGEAGYATAAAGKWQLYGADHYPERTRGAGTLPAEAGFEEWALWQVRTRPSRYWQPTLNVNGELQPYDAETYGPDVTTDFLLDFIEAHRDGPFFAYYPMNLPHFPFEPTPHSSSEGQSDQKNFEDMVAYTDHLVGRIADHVDSLGIAEETLIIFTGDNGTHRSLTSRLDGRSIQGGKWTPTEWGMRVPMVARMPGTVPEGATTDALVGFSDVLPTLAAFGRADLPAGVSIDGRSFAPVLRGETSEAKDALFSYYWPKPIQQPGEFADLRFAWDRSYKLYDDGRLYHWAEDSRETEAIMPGEGSPAEAAAREKLQAVLDSMPAEPQMLMRPEASGSR